MTSSRSVDASNGGRNPTSTEFRRGGPAGAYAADSEPTYPEFGSGFASSDDPAPNLMLEIISHACDSEKWEGE